MKSDKKLDREIELAWYRLAFGVTVNCMDLSRIFRDCRLEVSGGMTVDDAVRAAITRYQVTEKL